MATPSVRLVVTPQGWGSQVFVGDREIEGLQSVALDVCVDGSRLILTFAPTAVEVSGAAGSVVQSVRAVGFWRSWWAWIRRGELIEVTHLRSVATEWRKP